MSRGLGASLALALCDGRERALALDPRLSGAAGAAVAERGSRAEVGTCALGSRPEEAREAGPGLLPPSALVQL